MLFKNESNKITKGIFSGGIVYFTGHVLMVLASLSTASSDIGHYIAVRMFYLGSICKPIGILIIFKFLCDILNKVLKALDKYNNE